MDNAERLWLQDSLNRVGIQRAAEAIERQGAALPCRVVSVSGQVVTVAFDLDSAPWALPQVTIPIATSVYDWVPVQVDDTGVTLPADVYLGGITGLGGGTANTTRRGNLTSLVFVPVSVKSWTPPGTQNQRVVQGPGGAVLQIVGGGSSVTATSSGVTIKVGAKTWTFTSAGFTDSNGIVEETHVHSDPQGGVTGPPQ